MPQQNSPFIEAKYGWAFGESNWNVGMDENLLKFSFLFDRNVEGIVSSLPPPVDGQSWFLDTDNRIYFAVGSTFYSTPVPKWFVFTEKTTGDAWQFNGTTAVSIDSATDISSRLDSVEVTIDTLGTAAYEDVGFFATPVDVENEINELKADLADSTTTGKGAALVGVLDSQALFTSDNVEDVLDEIALRSIYGDNGKKYKFLGGVIAANGTPTLEFLNDAGHRPTGFTLSVTEPTSYSTQVNFSETATKVSTFIVAPDETYSHAGIVSGASVFTDRAIIQSSAPLTFKYAGFNAITAPPLWNSGGLIGNVLQPNGGVKITHPQVVTNEAPVVTALSVGANLFISSYTDTELVICAFDDMNGYVSYNGTTWTQTLSNNVVAPASIVFSGGNLTITHADVGTDAYNVTLGAFSTPYQVVVSNVSSTTIVINFYNAAGTLVTTADTNMKFFYRRNAKVIRNLNSVTFSVDRGQCLVPNSAYQNLPAGNFWLYGVMENSV